MMKAFKISKIKLFCSYIMTVLFLGTSLQAQRLKDSVSGIITYKSPSKDLKDITIQMHKGYPRFGSSNFYMQKPGMPSLTKEAKQHRAEFKAGYFGFENLAQMHLMESYFKDMDKEYLTPRPKNSKDASPEDVRSYLAQDILNKIAFNQASEDLKQRYFCKNEAVNCRMTNIWGGHPEDEFVANEKYAEFVKNYYTTIKKWSTNFFSDGSETLYLITQTNFVSDYDFDKNGYWIKLPIGTKRYGNRYFQKDSYFTEYAPETNYGRAIQSKTSESPYLNGEVFIKINPEKAENLANKKLRNLFMATKITVKFKDIEGQQPYMEKPRFTYHYADQSVEIFEDEGLKLKVGEIWLDNLEYKD